MDDAGLLLLARLESILVEIRDSQQRMEASADVLGRQRAADAARKKSKRAEERADHRPSEPHSHTAEVVALSPEIPGRVPGNPRTLQSLVLSSCSNDLATNKEKKKKEITESAEIRGQTWIAYSKAYATRYGAGPTRNAKTNSQIKQLVARLGVESPDVAAYFVSHSRDYYVVRGHSLGLLLSDCEALRTEWFTGRQMTRTAARQTDRTAANLEAIRPLLRGDGS